MDGRLKASVCGVTLAALVTISGTASGGCGLLGLGCVVNGLLGTLYGLLGKKLTNDLVEALGSVQRVADVVEALQDPLGDQLKGVLGGLNGALSNTELKIVLDGVVNGAGDLVNTVTHSLPLGPILGLLPGESGGNTLDLADRPLFVRDDTTATYSAASVGQNSGTVHSESKIYQARFTSGDWTGELLAYALHDGSGHNGCTESDPIGKLCPQAVWESGAKLDALSDPVGSREILTYDWIQEKGIPLQLAPLTELWNALTGLNVYSSTYFLLGADKEQRIAYMRGDRSNEGATYRSRASLLGDIVHSKPLYVGAPSRRYPDVWHDKLGGALPENSSDQSYSEFKAQPERTPVIYVGANDGFLHAFNAENGKELLAYMPSKVLQNAHELLDPHYEHRYFVDGQVAEGDVLFRDGTWRTVLVGTLGKGGQGFFALDITNPNAFSEDNADDLVLWEFNDTDEPALPDDVPLSDVLNELITVLPPPLNKTVGLDAQLGYTYGKPAIVRLHNGRWGVIVGNGYNNTELLDIDAILAGDFSADLLNAFSATGEGSLYIVDVETGELIRRLDTGRGGLLATAFNVAGLSSEDPNGLSSVFPMDKDGDHIVDYVYAGDLFGQVWRFDVTSSNPANWHVSTFGKDGPTPLFAATDANGTPQSITTQVQVTAHPDGVEHGVMVFFGTGKYLENGDAEPNTAITHSFYGIWDKDFNTGHSSLDVNADLHNLKKHSFKRDDDLVKQEIDASVSTENGTFRRVTTNTVDYANKHGWYIDLKPHSGGAQGELVVTDPVLRGRTVVFNTYIPAGQSVGSGYLMVLDQRTGGRTLNPPFDVNTDRIITLDDQVEFVTGTSEAPSGMRLSKGVNAPAFVVPERQDMSVVSVMDSQVREELINVQVRVAGRETWRQLQ